MSSRKLDNYSMNFSLRALRTCQRQSLAKPRRARKDMQIDIVLIFINLTLIFAFVIIENSFPFIGSAAPPDSSTSKDNR